MKNTFIGYINTLLLSCYQKRTIKIMKLTLIGLLFCISASYATNVHSQTARVNIKSSDVEARKVIEQIESQTDYLFVYNHTVNLSKKVSVDAENKTVAEVLSQMFEGSDIVYAVEGNNILLLKKNEKDTEITPVNTGRRTPQTSVSSGGIKAPETIPQSNTRRITGIIMDSSGETVIGANIKVKGKNEGSVSDINGNFSLNVEPGAILVVSFVGYDTQEVAVGTQNNLTITLRENTNILDELVVVGYGSQKKVNLAGAVESVDAKALESRSTSNVALSLQGLVPNLTITPGSGQADDVPKFNIRGETSINGGAPLILIDGIPTDASDFARMNGADIENISVLKDASSAAIYGARAAFGVILITTKKGKGEKLTVHFNNNFNVRTLTRMPKIVTDPYITASYKKEMGKPWYDLYTDEDLEYALKRREDPSLPGTIIDSQDPTKYKYLDNTNWFDEVFDNIGTTNSHNLSISGASPKVSYYLGAEVHQERGMLKINKDKSNRYNVRSKVDYKPTSWLTIGNNTALTYYTYDKPMNFYSWMFNTILSTNPLVPVYNPDGSYTSQGSQIVGTLKEGGESKFKKSTVYSQFTADIELIKNTFNIKADFTAKFINEKLNEWDSDRTIPYRDGPDSPLRYHGWTNFAQSTTYNTNYTMINVYGDFRKELGKHSFSAVGGFSQEYETYEKFFGKRIDLITDTYPTPELAVGEMTINENKYAWVVRSGFYRLNYIFDGKYIFETNGRYDGTSRFRKDDRFGFFPSVSAAWIVSNEKFFEPIHSWFNHAKLRASYGSLGNQGVDPNNPNYYPYIATMSANKINYLVNGEKPMGVNPPGLVSNALTWEKVYTMNFGVDFNFLSNRLVSSFDYYRRDTKDMLTVGRELPNVLGTGEPKINAADLKTTGWELSLLWRDAFKVGGKPFDYSARFILSDSRSVITKFDNPTKYLNNFADPNYYVGMEIGEIWGLETLGFFKDEEDIKNSPDQWDVTSYPGDRPIEPGDLKYKDQNGDNKITRGARTVDDPGDYKKIGNSRSRYNYGLDLNASWRGFDLRILLQGVGKKDFFANGYKFTGIFTGPWGSVFENNLDHWTPDNPNGYFPRLKSYLDWGSGDLSEPQTRYLQNAAYMRMRNLTVGYSLPKSMMSKIGVGDIRIYFSGENLFEITKLNKNYDPEGLNSGGHPYQRTFSFGLNISL